MGSGGLILIFVMILGLSRGFMVGRCSSFRRMSALGAVKGSKASSESSEPHWLVIVESPSKCPTIQEILQDLVKDNDWKHTFRVVSCKGHVRNLPKKKSKSSPDPIPGISLPTPERQAYIPHYEITNPSVVQELKKSAKEASKVVLATDPDREGEGIAWHLQQVLELDDYQRITFSEITPTAIQKAFQQEEENLVINQNLVQAQETRRMVDRLAGFTISPPLWHILKIPGLSAGRVQSVALGLVVDREHERLAFEPQEYVTVEVPLADSTITAQLQLMGGQAVVTTAADLDDGKKKKQKLLLTHDTAESLISSNKPTTLTITNATQSIRTTQPPLPYKTSTLQQDAFGRLGWSVTVTMRNAQELYNAGYISYMRTDSTDLSETAQTATRETAQKLGPIQTDEKVAKKDSTAAHEAIRPALKDGFVLPDQVEGVSVDARNLYAIIYQRTLATVLLPHKVESTVWTLTSETSDGTLLTWRATTRRVVQPGFRQVYPASTPPVYETADWEVGDMIKGQAEVNPHTTQPPARYNEASLVQALETSGVGRPSTFASTVQLLRDRTYVHSNGNQRRKRKEATGTAIPTQRAAGSIDTNTKSLVPSLTAMVVGALLKEHVPTYLDPAFTATMEERLDQIAVGQYDVTSYLDEFYVGLVDQVERMQKEATPQARRVPLDIEGIDVLCGPWGPYIQRDDETIALPPGLAQMDALEAPLLHALVDCKTGLVLGEHEGKDILLKTGRYGPYLQWGDEPDMTRHSIPPEKASYTLSDEQTSLLGMVNITLEEAIAYVQLPRTVGTHQDSNITAAIGPYGPYLKHNNQFTSLTKEYDVLSIDEETAIQVISTKKTAKNVVAELGEKEGAMVFVKSGRYGIYLNWKKVNAKLPSEYHDTPSHMPLDEAWELIQAKEPSSTKKTSKKAGKKDAKKKALPKRPQSAYLYFCAAHRKEVSEGRTMGQVSKELARVWAETTDRSQYQALADADKERYQREKGEGTKSTTSDKPKRPPSAYMLFCKEYRPTILNENGEKLPLGATTQRLAQLWRESDDTERFHAMAAEAKEAAMVE